MTSLKNLDLSRCITMLLQGMDQTVNKDNMSLCESNLSRVRSFYNNKISFRAAKTIMYLWQSLDLTVLTTDDLLEMNTLFDNVARTDLTRSFDWNDTIGQDLGWFKINIVRFLNGQCSATNA